MITIPCKVSKGQFSFEYFVEVTLLGEKRQLFVDKSKIHNTAKELSDPTESVDGEVEVFVVEEDEDTILVELPGDPIIGGRRSRIPKGYLKLSKDAEIDLRMKRTVKKLREIQEKYPTYDSEQGKSSGDFV